MISRILYYVNLKKKIFNFFNLACTRTLIIATELPTTLT